MTRSQIGSFAVGVLGVALAIVVVGAVVRHGTAPEPAVRTASAPAVEKPAPDSGTAGKAEAPAPKAATASGRDEPASADKQAGAQQKPVEGSDQTAKAAPAPAAADTSAAAKAPTAEAKPVVPSFDVLRVESDGSTVIAGRAAPDADVAIMNGGKRLAATHSDENGDFVAVLDPPLAPGDYELSLKATGKDSKAVSSIETATVSVPEDKKGDLLAMVTKPGAASRIVTAPKPPSPAPAPEAKASADQPPAATSPAPAEAALGAAPPEPAKAARIETEAAPAGDRPAADDATAGDHVRVDAVEIEGNSLYVAGSATTGRKVRVYADGRLAGEDPSARKGRFVVESSTDLKPGAHTIRADLVDPRTGDVVVRATVPFTRPEGDQFAAVAPSSSGKDAGSGVQASAAVPSADASRADQAAPDASGGPKTVMQPALTNSDDFVIIRRGDTLWQIARRVYGRGVRYTTIYLANTSQITDPDLILPGQIFDVPAKSLPDAEKVHRRLRDGGKASG